MRIWQTGCKPRTLSLPQSGLCRLFESITDSDETLLPKTILSIIRSEVDVLNCALFLLPTTGQPWLLGHAETTAAPGMEQAWNAYVHKHHRHDMALQEILRTRHRGDLVQSTMLLHQDANDIIDAGYRTVYDSAGTSQRFAIFRQLKDNHGLLICAYRAASSRAFSSSDLDFLELSSPCLSEAAVQRYQVLPPNPLQISDKLEALQNDLQIRLSKREYEIVLCIARGLTLPSAADAMGIQPASAITYRKRAFEKLEIRTQRELFSRLMAPTVHPQAYSGMGS